MAAIFTFEAVSERAAATLQQTTFGVITYCESTWRGGPHCKYTFTVDGAQYVGASSAADYGSYGQAVVVYYTDPALNSLIDFSTQYHRDRSLACFFLLGAIACIAYSVYLRQHNE